MDKGGEQQQVRKAEEEKGDQGKKAERLEGLPLESSPYTRYKDVEDYKRQGYGTQGHQEPKGGRGAGSTDAPTLSGTGAAESQLFPTDTGARRGGTSN